MSLTGKMMTLHPKLLEASKKYPHLRDYLRRVVEEVGAPQYYEALPSSLKKATYVNVIYPVGEGIFIHVYMPPRGTESGYRKYQIIEPPEPPREVIELVEEKMAEYIDENYTSRSDEEKLKLLYQLLDKSVEVRNGPIDYSKINPRISKKIPVTNRDYELLVYYMVKNKVELGPLAPLLKDPYIEDISCDGVGYVFIVHKIFGPLETSIRFDSEEVLDRFVLQLSERIGKPASHARPIVDASLPDGSRINIVFGSEVSLRGSNFTIRRVAKVPISVTQLIDWNTFNEEIGAYLWILLSEGMSGFICGETASGKTTTLNAIIAFIRPTAKIVTIEDTAEVQVPHDNWTRELTRDTGSQESSITMFDLLKAALRQRPNYIIVGEIRGAEGNVAFQAMQSVSWDTPIVVKEKYTGIVRVLPIGEFVDEFYPEGGEYVPKHVRNYQTLTVNSVGGIVWSDIRYVTRHRTSNIYRVKYGSVGEVKATSSHSIFILDEDDCKIKPMETWKLRPGDILVKLGSELYTHVLNLSRKQQPSWEVIGYPQAQAMLNIKATAGSQHINHTGKRVFPVRPLFKLLENANLEGGIVRDLKFDLENFKNGFIDSNVAREVVRCLTRRYNMLGDKSRSLLGRIEQILRSDVDFVRVEEVVREDYEGYVYDLSVPGTESFFGGEVPILLHNTGHPVLSTFHAGSVERLVQRITSPPINVAKTMLDNLNFVVMQSAVYREGVMIRRVLSVNELQGYDPVSNSIIYIPSFLWDPARDTFRFVARGSSYLLEEKIGVARGIPKRRMKLIYDELELRAKILREMVNKKIFNYYEVFKIIVKIHHLIEEKSKGLSKEESIYGVINGLEESLKRLKRGKL